MNVMVSLSNTPMAHPPRSNPFLRSSSDAPPFPCITPSTVTCVMVVSFIIVVPFSLGRLVGGLSPLPRTLLPRSDTASRISFEDYLVRRLKRSDVAAPAQLLFEVYTDVERWPEWIASVTSVERLDQGPLSVEPRSGLPVAIVARMASW